MQTTLLAVAIAIILALVAALVAPLVVDWSLYRSAFEDEASRLTGLTVRVNGTIEARILPSPHIKLRDVEVGEAGREPQIRAGVVELEVGLGPLMRGEVRATEVRLLMPQIRLGLDAGALDWPSPSSSFDAETLTVSRLNVENGRITFADTASGSRLVLEKLSFDGDIRSFLGPFNGEGAFFAGGKSYSYRISGNHVDEDGGIKIRLGDRSVKAPAEHRDRGHAQFRARRAAVRRHAFVGAAGRGHARGRRAGHERSLAARRKVQRHARSASSREIALQYGPEERAVIFSGKAELKFGARPHLDGELIGSPGGRRPHARRSGHDASPAAGHVQELRRGVYRCSEITVPVAASVAIDAVTAGGTTIQTCAAMSFDDDKGWSLDDSTFRAPGLTDVSLSGQFGAARRAWRLVGPASIELADLKTLLAWLEGRGDQRPDLARKLESARPW